MLLLNIFLKLLFYLLITIRALVVIVKNSTQLMVQWLMPLASQYLLLVLCNVQAEIKMLLRATC